MARSYQALTAARAVERGRKETHDGKQASEGDGVEGDPRKTETERSQ